MTTQEEQFERENAQQVADEKAAQAAQISLSKSKVSPSVSPPPKSPPPLVFIPDGESEKFDVGRDPETEFQIAEGQKAQTQKPVETPPKKSEKIVEVPKPSPPEKEGKDSSQKSDSDKTSGPSVGEKSKGVEEKKGTPKDPETDKKESKDSEKSVGETGIVPGFSDELVEGEIDALKGLVEDKKKKSVQEKIEDKLTDTFGKDTGRKVGSLEELTDSVKLLNLVVEGINTVSKKIPLDTFSAPAGATGIVSPGLESKGVVVDVKPFEAIDRVTKKIQQGLESNIGDRILSFDIPHQAIPFKEDDARFKPLTGVSKVVGVVSPDGIADVFLITIPTGKIAVATFTKSGVIVRGIGANSGETARLASNDAKLLNQIVRNREDGELIRLSTSRGLSARISGGATDITQGTRSGINLAPESFISREQAAGVKEILRRQIASPEISERRLIELQAQSAGERAVATDRAIAAARAQGIRLGTSEPVPSFLETGLGGFDPLAGIKGVATQSSPTGGRIIAETAAQRAARRAASGIKLSDLSPEFRLAPGDVGVSPETLLNMARQRAAVSREISSGGNNAERVFKSLGSPNLTVPLATALVKEIRLNPNGNPNMLFSNAIRSELKKNVDPAKIISAAEDSDNFKVEIRKGKVTLIDESGNAPKTTVNLSLEERRQLELLRREKRLRGGDKITDAVADSQSQIVDFGIDPSLLEFPTRILPQQVTDAPEAPPKTEPKINPPEIEPEPDSPKVDPSIFDPFAIPLGVPNFIPEEQPEKDKDIPDSDPDLIPEPEPETTDPKIDPDTIPIIPPLEEPNFVPEEQPEEDKDLTPFGLEVPNFAEQPETEFDPETGTETEGEKGGTGTGTETQKGTEEGTEAGTGEGTVTTPETGEKVGEGTGTETGGGELIDPTQRDPKTISGPSFDPTVIPTIGDSIDSLNFTEAIQIQEPFSAPLDESSGVGVKQVEIEKEAISSPPPPESPPSHPTDRIPPVSTLITIPTEGIISRGTGKRVRLNIPSFEGESVSIDGHRIPKKGSIAWKQGFLWIVIFPPYGPNNVIWTRTRPKGIRITTAKKASETITQIGGTIPQKTLLSLGIVEAAIESRATGPKINFALIKGISRRRKGA